MKFEKFDLICESVVLCDRIDVKALLCDRTLVGFGAPHVESHTVWENSNLFEAKGLAAPRALSFISDNEVGTLHFSFFDLRIE